MIVVLQDRTELLVSQKTADAIARSLSKSSEGYMTINGELIKKSFIVRIKKGGITEADMPKPNDPNKRLKSDNRTEEEQWKAGRKASASVREILKKKRLVKRM